MPLLANWQALTTSETWLNRMLDYTVIVVYKSVSTAFTFAMTLFNGSIDSCVASNRRALILNCWSLFFDASIWKSSYRPQSLFIPFMAVMR